MMMGRWEIPTTGRHFKATGAISRGCKTGRIVEFGWHRGVAEMISLYDSCPAAVGSARPL